MAAVGTRRAAARPRTLVVTLHGSDVGLLAKPGVAPIGRMVASHARFVAAVSDALLEEARGPSTCDASRSGVVPMPIVVDTPGPLTPSLQAPHGGDRDRPCVAREGLRRAAGGAGPARAAGADVRLELVGSGPEQSSSSPRANGWASATRSPSSIRIARAALHARVLAAHAVVVPSRREGLGLVAVEALALGRPVIAPRTGGLPEVVTAGRWRARHS